MEKLHTCKNMNERVDACAQEAQPAGPLRWRLVREKDSKGRQLLAGMQRPWFASQCLWSRFLSKLRSVTSEVGYG